jgi:hypothetical protein
VDHHNTTGEFNPSVHSFNGVNSVSLSGWSYSSDQIMLKATAELPEFPFNEDMNSGHHLGFGESLRPVATLTRVISVIVQQAGYKRQLAMALEVALQCPI